MQRMLLHTNIISSRSSQQKRFSLCSRTSKKCLAKWFADDLQQSFPAWRMLWPRALSLSLSFLSHSLVRTQGTVRLAFRDFCFLGCCSEAKKGRGICPQKGRIPGSKKQEGNYLGIFRVYPFWCIICPFHLILTLLLVLLLPVYLPLVDDGLEEVLLLAVQGQVGGEDGLLHHAHHVTVVVGVQALRESWIR